MTDAPGIDTIDLSDNALFRHGFPHDLFTRLRAEAPVWRRPRTPGIEAVGAEAFWVVSNHADVVAVSHDPARFRSYEGPRLAGWEPRMRGQMLITMDPPDHTRLRRLVSAGFTPRMVAKLDDQARQWAIQIADAAVDKGECNFVHEVAYQLPMHMIADMVGIPVSDRDHLFTMVNRLLYGLDPESDAPLTPDEMTALQGQVFMYGRELAEQKRADPTDDVWTTLTTAEVELPDGTKTSLTEMELDLFFLVLIVAGSETTRNAISSGLVALLDNPAQMDKLRNDPSVMDTAADEIVRWASPVTYFRRTAVEDTVLHDMEISSGDAVTLWYPSANRDEAAFADPFAFDVARKPNPHVGFGGPGIHFCLGANLARREIKVMFEELLARTSGIELLGEPRYSVSGVQSPVSCSMKELPVRLAPR